MNNMVRDWRQNNGPVCPKCSCGGNMVLDMEAAGKEGVTLYLWKCEKCGQRILKKEGEEKRPELTFEEKEKILAGALALRGEGPKLKEYK